MKTVFDFLDEIYRDSISEKMKSYEESGVYPDILSILALPVEQMPVKLEKYFDEDEIEALVDAVKKCDEYIKSEIFPNISCIFSNFYNSQINEDVRRNYISHRREFVSKSFGSQHSCITSEMFNEPILFTFKTYTKKERLIFGEYLFNLTMEFKCFGMN